MNFTTTLTQSTDIGKSTKNTYTKITATQKKGTEKSKTKFVFCIIYKWYSYCNICTSQPNPPHITTNAK